MAGHHEGLPHGFVSKKPRECDWCSSSYLPNSSRQRYCKECAPNKWASALIRRYGISHKDLIELYEYQDGNCAICYKELAYPEQYYDQERTGKRSRDIAVDHCHSTGKVRGLLCISCNTRLNALEDHDWLSKAMDYLGGDD